MDEFDDFSSFAERDFLSLMTPFDISSSSPEFLQEYEAINTTNELLEPMIKTYSKGIPEKGYVQGPILLNESNSSSEPIVPTSTNVSKKRKESEIKESQKEASKKYRERKKAMITKLQEQVETLKREKAAINGETTKLVEDLRFLKYQNQKLRNSQTDEVKKIAKERAELLQILEKLLENPNSTDEEIWSYVYKLRECCKELITIGECNWRMLVSPTTAHYLQAAGFFEDSNIALDNPGDSTSLRQYANRIIQHIPNLSSNQIKRINEVVAEYYKGLAPLQEERAQICKDIEKFFASPSFSNEKDFTKAAEVIGTIELLRSNLSKETANWGKYTVKMLDHLTARQAALLYLRVEVRHRAIMQLKSIWETLSNVVKIK